jgi:NAD+ kinase
VRVVGRGHRVSFHDGAFRRVGLLVHPERDPSQVVAVIASWAQDGGAELVCSSEQAALVPAARTTDEDELGASTDLVIAVGGDGTILRALRAAAPFDVPVLGVNLGRLGFLAEVEQPDLAAALAAIGRGAFTVEHRTAVEFSVAGDGAEGVTGVAYNDVVLTRVPGEGQATLGVHVDDNLLARYAADALIIATPTGSTAYNFSVGGPIVSPRLAGLLISPVAPHGTFRSTVLIHPDERLGVEVLQRSAPLVLEADGRKRGELVRGSRFVARVGAHPALVVRFGHSSFYERARSRLQLRDAPGVSRHEGR